MKKFRESYASVVLILLALILLPHAFDALAKADKVTPEDSYQKAYESGYDQGYYDGYEAGRQEGYASGNKEGHAEGYSEGYSEGYDDCLYEHGLIDPDATKGYGRIERQLIKAILLSFYI